MPDEIDLLRLFRNEVPGPSTDAWVRAKAAIAAAREEDRLRQGTGRSVADLRAPARITRRAARRQRRRLGPRSAAAVVVVLTAGAVVLAVIGVPSTRHDRTDLAAYVVKQVDSALSTAEPAEIAHMTVTTSGAAVADGTTTVEEWSYGDRWRSVTYAPAGHPVDDEGLGSASVYTLVSYPARIWARQAILAQSRPVSGRNGCGQVAAAFLLLQPGLPATGSAGISLPPTVASALRAAISCGILAVAGRQRVDGIEATELTSTRNSPVSETIWVSPDTYLPVRVIVRSAPGKQAVQQTADITWLPVTAQNLARLIVPIPAGFRQLSLTQAIGPKWRQVQGGLPQTPKSR